MVLMLPFFWRVHYPPDLALILESVNILRHRSSLVQIEILTKDDGRGPDMNAAA